MACINYNLWHLSGLKHHNWPSDRSLKKENFWIYFVALQETGD